MRGRTDEEFLNDILGSPRFSAYANIAKALYPDPEDPGATAVLARGLKVAVMGGTGGLLKDRINLIRKHLKVQNTHLPFGHPDRKPRIFFDRSCVETIREFDAYKYPDIKVVGPNKEAPLKKDDHGPEALSRFFGSYFGRGNKSSAPRQRKARIG
jgi:hypothetical protein